MYVYSNNGMSFHAVPDDYEPKPGEVTFPEVATPDQLALSFPGYLPTVNARKAFDDAYNGYDQAIAAGVQIEFSAFPALNATYALDDASIQNIIAVASSIANGMGFPSGEETFGWPDINFIPHEMTQDQFKKFGAAMQAFVWKLKQWRMITSQGGTAILPAQPVIIS